MMEVNEVLCLKWNNHKSIFLQNLSSLRTQELYSDATIACNGKYFSVHRLVLSTCSEYFEEIFERISMQSIHPFIIVTNIESGYLEALLNFMYNGEVNVLHEMLPGLIKAAEILKIKGLAVPDEQALENELVYAREVNPVADPHSNSPTNHSPIHKSQPANENPPGNCIFPDDINIHPEVNASSIQNEETTSNSQTYHAKEEVIEMHPIESPREYISNSEEVTTTNTTVTSIETESEIKLENEPQENQMEAPEIAMEATIEHSLPQQHTSPALIQSTSCQDNIPITQDSLQCSGYTANEVCEKEAAEIGFIIDHTNMKNNSWDESCNLKEDSNVVAATVVQEVIHGLLLQSECDTSGSTHENGGFIPPVQQHLRHSIKCEDESSTRPPKVKRRNPSSPPSLTSTSKKCPKCSYVTKYVSTLRRHIMFKHTGEKPHKCHYCPYRSAHNFNMKKHMMIHTGEKPFSCPLCPYKAAQNSNIKSHMKSHEKKLLKAAIKGTRRDKM